MTRPATDSGLASRTFRMNHANRVIRSWSALAFMLALLPGLVAAQVSPGPRVVPGAYRGTLGQHQIEMRLKLQENAEDSVEGSYFVFGETDIIMVVGEFEAGELVMEESHNGRDVSGGWQAKIRGDHLIGNWTDASGENEQAVDLHRVGPLPPE